MINKNDITVLGGLLLIFVCVLLLCMFSVSTNFSAGAAVFFIGVGLIVGGGVCGKF
jgi:hypothetical protein